MEIGLCQERITHHVKRGINKVWVYGGRRNVDKQIVVMDDIMHFDSTKNKWHKGVDNSRVKPKARYAHVMFWYFNYLIVFGGMSHGGELLGDLWVYDVTKELWHPVIDNKNLLELQTLNVSGIIPKERAYASGVMMKIIGAAYMVGGRNAEGFAWDLWALRIDRIIQHIEDPDTVGIENFWIKKEFDENEDMDVLCRFGHSSEEVTNSTFFVYGGVNKQNEVISKPLLYDVVEQTLTELQERGVYVPQPRNKPSLLATGNQMILMYGGVDPKRRGYLTDLWHLKIDAKIVYYEKVLYDTKGTAYMVSWRTGFTMEYLRGINDPHLIGGTYGNNQQVQSLISIPEQECSSMESYESSTCSPWPHGSIYDAKIDDCHWCADYEYFEEDFQDYFKSKWVPWPRGLIGGTYKSWVPWESGFIFSSREKSHCKKWDDDKLCPLGTKYEFLRDEYIANMDEIKINNNPHIFEPEDNTVNRVSTIVVLTLLFMSLISIIFIAVLLSACKERFLFIFREVDMLPITGGRRKKVIGGVLIVLFFLYISIIWSGFLIDFMIYNERRETAETSNPFLQKELPSSYEIEIEAYCSKVKESNTPFLVFNATGNEKPDANPNDLWSKSNLSIIDSTYFKNAFSHNISWTRIRLNDFTDKYRITVKYRDIPKSDIKDQFVNFGLKSDHTQVFHFFKWRLKSIWDYANEMETSWSELEGIMTPQTLKETNKNITSGFKGPIPTVIHFSLIPTHYVDEVAGMAYKGYRVHLSKFDRGSTVNKRTLTNRYTAMGDDLEGFQVQFMMNTASTLFQVRIEKVKSIIELFAYMLGFLAGFILIVRVAKYDKIQ